MDNCLSNNGNQAQKHDQVVTSDHPHHNLKEDIASARLAWEAWKSDDPKQWDRAMDEKQRILHEDPKAWKIAMKQIDAEDAAAKAAKAAELQRQQEEARLAAEATAKADAAPQPMEAAAPQPQQLPDEVVVAKTHPGYAPDSPYAPAPPVSPGFDAAYNTTPAKFYGLNLGLIKLGVNSHGSIEAGVNIGIARVGGQVGLENRVEGEFMPVGGPLHARVGAGVGVNKNGFHGEAGAGANVFNLVGGDADVGARLGRDVGVDADVRGKALFVNGQGDAGASLGERGLRAYGGGNADLAGQLGARGGGRFALGQDSGIAAGVGLKAGEKTLDFGPSIDAEGDQVVPRLNLHPDKTENAPFYPTGDRTLDPQ